MSDIICINCICGDCRRDGLLPLTIACLMVNAVSCLLSNCPLTITLLPRGNSTVTVVAPVWVVKREDTQPSATRTCVVFYVCCVLHVLFYVCRVVCVLCCTCVVCVLCYTWVVLYACFIVHRLCFTCVVFYEGCIVRVLLCCMCVILCLTVKSSM